MLHHSSSPLGGLAYPTYLEVVQRIGDAGSFRSRLANNEQNTFFHLSSEDRHLSLLSVPAGAFENFVRRGALSRPAVAECSDAVAIAKSSMLAGAVKYSAITWKNFLHQYGYDCTAQLYLKLSKSMNKAMSPVKNSIAKFDSLLTDLQGVDRAKFSGEVARTKKVLNKNHHLVFFPPLGWEVPCKRPRSQLTVTEWKKSGFYSPGLKQRFETGYELDGTAYAPMGLPYDMVERVSVEELGSRQIPDSIENFLNILKARTRANSSARVFLRTHNHLGFWDLSPEAEFSLMLRSLMGAKELGFLN